jgi:hypothetical protein
LIRGIFITRQSSVLTESPFGVVDHATLHIHPLCQDERVFTVNAPGDDVFAFSYVAALRYAVAALAHDAQLERVRFALVPKRYDTLSRTC